MNIVSREKRKSEIANIKDGEQRHRAIAWNLHLFYPNDYKEPSASLPYKYMETYSGGRIKVNANGEIIK